MGLFDKILGKANNEANASRSGQPAESKSVIEAMIMTAGAAVNNGDYERAVKTYKSILELEPNETAQYNLGSLYAQGKGVGQDFMEAAYWFHQAEESGDQTAGKLCMRCMIDYTNQDFEKKTPEALFIDMMRFVKYVYPNENAELKAGHNLSLIAGSYFNKKEYARAAKLFRAAAQFGNNGYSQNYLAVLYNAGAGVEKNDFFALYWFDKAVDNGVEAALKDKNGILNAYRANLTAQEFYEYFMMLSSECSMGSEDIPKDAAKAVYWRKIAESIA